MSTAVLTRQRYTVQEYLERERTAEYKSEFYNGEILPMAGGTFSHSLIGINVARTLSEFLDETPCRVANADMRIRIRATGLYTYPDASVVCEEPEFEDGRQDTLLNPLLIVEVLSDSTEQYDREGKFDQYKQIPSFREYLLISQHEPSVTVFRRAADGSWPEEVVRGLEAEIRLDSVGCTVPLALFYRKVAFPTG